jgi:hypothetical protein
MNITEKFQGESVVHKRAFNRFLLMMKNYEMAIISACRRKIEYQHPEKPLWKGYEEYANTGKYVKRELEHNLLLVRMLQNLDYGVIQVKSGYPKKSNTKQTLLTEADHCFIVFNLYKNLTFQDNLIKISTFFNQDTVGFVDKGTDPLLYHIRTNDSSKRKPYLFKEEIGKMQNDEVIQDFFTKIKGYYLVVKEEYLKELTNKNFYHYFDTGVNEMFEDEKYLGWQSKLLRRKRAYDCLASLDIKEAKDWNGRTAEEHRKQREIAKENNAKTTRPECPFAQ